MIDGLRAVRQLLGALCLALLSSGPGTLAEELDVAPANPPGLEPRRTEVGGLPLFAYDSDTGLLLGALASVARFEPGASPYAWRLQAVLSTSLKNGPGGLGLPLHDDSVSLDVPGFEGGALRLGVEAYFRRYRDAGWYGPGGDSSAAAPPPDPAIPGSGDWYHRYGRIYPGASLNTRWRLWERGAGPERRRLEALVGGQLDYSSIQVQPGSLLDQQLRVARSGGGPDVAELRDLLRGADDHLLGKLRLGLLYDSRDQETSPTRGIFLEASARIAPAPADLRHAGFFASAAGFAPLAGDRLVLGGRILGDAMVGHPPFYALSEAGVATPGYAPGGSSTVRGVLLQRFAGKLKVVAGVELRGRVVRFTVGSQRFRLGALAFADAGRAWADWHRVVLAGRDVDGPWTRVAVGLGGGVRLAWGEALVIRADLARSPTEQTSGLYIGIGEVF